MNKYVRFRDFKLKSLTLSYDDGVRQDKRLISIMQKYGLKGTFNVNAGLFSDKYEGIEKGRMTVNEARDLYLPSGMEIAVHGYNHLSLGAVDTALAVEDVLSDRKGLENVFGSVINGMAYANGSYNDEVVELLKKIGINWARTTRQNENFDLPDDFLKWHSTCHHDNSKLMELAKQFVEQEEHWYFWARKLQLFYVWGHSYEFDNNDNWETIEKFAEYVGGRDDIWYATNGEIYEYLKAAERLQFSADGSLVKNPSSIDIYIDCIGNKVVVPSGKTVRIK